MGLSVRQTVRVAAMIGAVVIVAATATAAQAPPAGDPFAIESTALVPLDDELSISIVGIHGQITVSTRAERELRVVSRAPGSQGADLPVGIWQVGSKMIVAPAPGDPNGARMLNVEVPKGFLISVDAVDSDVVIQSEGGDIELRGTNVRASIQAVGGSTTADLTGGKLTVNESMDATVRVRGTATTISAISGNVNVRATGGRIALAKIEGPTDIESDGSTLVFDGLSGSLHVKAQKGDATVVGSIGGAELELSGTPLRLKDGTGDLTVSSDATVDFATMAALMHFDMHGGSLRGKGNAGILEVRARNTEVNVQSILEGMRLEGDGLKAQIVEVGGELHVETTVSDIFVDRVASVILKVDGGNVTIQRAAGPVQATVVGADIHILDGSGPVTLDADRGEAEVAWASMGGGKDSNLTNKGGSLTVRIPGSGWCQVDAKSTFGRIDSDIPTVKVTDDLTEARGPVNSGSRPTIRIVANGDIHILGAEKVGEAK